MARKWGILTDTDVAAIETAIDTLLVGFPGATLRVVEIGICHGDSARAINEQVTSAGRQLQYWGVDSDKDRRAGNAACSSVPPFPGANVITGDSAEVFARVPEGLHLAFVDGCHCVNHVMLDFLHYGPLVVEGGMLVMHDVAPRAQRKCDYQGHGPNDEDFGTATHQALQKLGMGDLLWGVRGAADQPTMATAELRAPWASFRQWKLVRIVHDGGDWGGTLVLQKTGMEGSEV